MVLTFLQESTVREIITLLKQDESAAEKNLGNSLEFDGTRETTINTNLMGCLKESKLREISKIWDNLSQDERAELYTLMELGCNQRTGNRYVTIDNFSEELEKNRTEACRLVDNYLLEKPASYFENGLEMLLAADKKVQV